MRRKFFITLGWIFAIALFSGCGLLSESVPKTITPLNPELAASPYPTLTHIPNLVTEATPASPEPSTGIQVPPAADDPRLLMLFSHARWQSLWADVIVTNYLGDEAHTVIDQIRTQIWLQQPASGRVLSGPANGTPERMWVSDGLAMQEDGGEILNVGPVTLGDFSPPFAVDSVTPHPYGGMMGTMTADFILPTGLGQRSGEYRLVGRESWAGRDTLVTEYYRYPNDPVLERLWVDADTGVILRYASFGKPGGGPLSIELQVQAIQYDLPISPEFFVFNQPLPAAFAAAP